MLELEQLRDLLEVFTPGTIGPVVAEELLDVGASSPADGFEVGNGLAVTDDGVVLAVVLDGLEQSGEVASGFGGGYVRHLPSDYEIEPVSERAAEMTRFCCQPSFAGMSPFTEGNSGNPDLSGRAFKEEEVRGALSRRSKWTTNCLPHVHTGRNGLREVEPPLQREGVNSCVPSSTTPFHALAADGTIASCLLTVTSLISAEST